MPSLFVLPRQVPLSSSAGLLAGAKLTFSATGSSTPQNTYSDIGLTVAHANPVIADANGVFPKIYLNPSLPHYRVKLTTSADVLVYQEDDVPSNQNTSQQFRLKAAAPSLTFEETDATSNNGRWRIRAQSEQLLVELLDDAETTAVPILTLDRNGTTPDTSIAATTTDTFTGTLTGMSGTVTGTVSYTIVGAMCTLRGIFTGTSNATSMTLTGLPAVVRPTTAAVAVACLVTDNGAVVGGWGRITSGGDLVTFGKGIDNNTSGFTNSGTKGLASGFIMTYPLA
jgi:hypothetical protein